MRDVAHPAPISVPTASLDTLSAGTAALRSADLSPIQTSQTAEDSQAARALDEALEPIRSVAPVSAARDEQDPSVVIPLAVIPGAAPTSSRKSKAASASRPAPTPNSPPG